MKYPRLRRLFLCLLLISPPTHPAPPPPIKSPSIQDDYASLVEKGAATLTEDQLADDSLILQEFVSDHSIYRHDKTEKHGAPIFIRKGNDGGKGVIVLREGEDFLPQCNKKKTFVVLKNVGGNQYRIFYAYVRSSLTDPAAPPTIEWDTWFPRGNNNNKALQFGPISCHKSSMVPCKKEPQLASDDSADYEDFSNKGSDVLDKIVPKFPYKHPLPRIFSDGGPDYWCDLQEFTDSDKRFAGAVIGALTQAVAVLTGAELLYKDEAETMKQVNEEIARAALANKARGRSMTRANNSGENLLNMGRSTVAGGTILFYSSVVKLGALAIGETPPNEDISGEMTEDKMDEVSQGYKAIGMNILRSLFRGVDFDDPEQKGVTANPHDLLNENTVAALVAGKSVGEAIAENSQMGRGILHWLMGGADVGTSSSNGEQAIRQYKGVQKDGSVTGSKGVDNLNFAIDNAFGGTKKSAGQVFTENLMAGAYMPYGIVEDVADALGGSVLGVGKTSDDRTYVDDLADKVINVVGGAAGQIVDVVGDILGPIGLGGLWTGVAGVSAAAAGAVGAGLGIFWGAPGLAIYHGVKLGAKALGIGGVIGMNGSGSRAANEGGNQNVDRDSGPQIGQTYGQEVGRRRRKREINDIVNKHLHIQGITDVDLFTHLGWKTVQTRQENLATANFSQDVPFLGFGKCIDKGTSVADFQSVKSARVAAKLYFQTMRTACLKDQMDSFNELITEGYVKFNDADKTFNIPDKHPILTKPKLTHAETNALGKSLEMSVYSKNYMLAAKKGAPKEGTRTADTMKSMVLLYLQEAATRAPVHYAKLTRNVAKLVKTAFTKYKYCRKCQKEPLRDTLNDCVLFSALLEFVLKEQEHPAYAGLTKEAAFSKHFDWSAQSTTTKLSIYFL